MPKEKKAKEVKTTEKLEDKVSDLIKKRAPYLFDREPSGSLVDGEVAKLSKEILKVK